MKRILITKPLPEIGTLFSPEPDQRHHLQNVRRVRAGERVEILDGAGGLALGVVHLKEHQLAIRIVEKPDVDRESPLKICLALALPSHRKTIDHLIPALVQLGIWQVKLVDTQYSGHLKGSKQKLNHRFNKIAQESLKQCGRLLVPEILVDEGFEDTCASMERELEMNLIFHPLENQRGTSVNVADGSARSQPLGGPIPNGLGLFIGPEGGFSADEVDCATSHGFRVRHLGPRVLRTETAVVGACFWAQALFGDLSRDINGR